MADLGDADHAPYRELCRRLRLPHAWRPGDAFLAAGEGLPCLHRTVPGDRAYAVEEAWWAMPDDVWLPRLDDLVEALLRAGSRDLRMVRHASGWRATVQGHEATTCVGEGASAEEALLRLWLRLP